MDIYLYLDESGSIHKNSKTKYFAVGGYFTFKSDKNKIKSIYKSINLDIKRKNNINLEKELKSFDFCDKDKIRIFSKIQDIDNFYGCVKVFDKSNMNKEIIHSNIFFNYAVKVLIKDCILSILDEGTLNMSLNFIVSIDNRNIRVQELNNLENYLKTEFCTENYNFKVTYYDSKTNFCIQLADLVVNTFYNYYKDKRIVKKVIKSLKHKNFRVSSFPGHKIKGRIKKIEYNI